MKILLSDLASQDIQKLVINSLEQALYQAIVVINDEEHVVWESADKVLMSRNLMQLRQKFEKLEITEIFLRHESPYDEMIGLPASQESNRLEVPLGKNPYAQPNWLQ
ncbi:DUF6482 family protein [Agarilytica rhodophyticola]|uniref:DUF6482 family protein n=1 Tax=Agarilytica rhodophyticola TaxID=1737490 RepID=UPI000B3439D4|nr:DUF6482 family protein [Agarilytica rhodophyticola]